MVKCKRCNGSGAVMHHAWEIFWRENPSPFILDAIVQDWFRNNGWDVPPPEEVDCPECGGTGEVPSASKLKITKEEVDYVI